jgi:hypothetical protein
MEIFFGDFFTSVEEFWYQIFGIVFAIWVILLIMKGIGK